MKNTEKNSEKKHTKYIKISKKARKSYQSLTEEEK